MPETRPNVQHSCLQLITSWSHASRDESERINHKKMHLRGQNLALGDHADAITHWTIRVANSPQTSVFHARAGVAFIILWQMEVLSCSRRRRLRSRREMMWRRAAASCSCVNPNPRRTWHFVSAAANCRRFANAKPLDCRAITYVPGGHEHNDSCCTLLQ